MSIKLNSDQVISSCHCGNVTLKLTHPPDQIRHCNCSLCQRYGVLWTYYNKDDVTISHSENLDTYAWGDKNVDFFRCHTCGCITHWLPRDGTRRNMGINARLLEQNLLETAEIEYKDSPETGLFH